MREMLGVAIEAAKEAGKILKENLGKSIEIGFKGEINLVTDIDLKSEKTIVVFFWIPKEVHGAKLELSENKINYHRLKEFIDDSQKDIQEKILTHMVESKAEEFEEAQHFTSQQLFSEDFLLEARKLKLSFSKIGKPPVVTHNIPNEYDDEIIINLLFAAVFEPLNLNQLPEH